MWLQHPEILKVRQIIDGSMTKQKQLEDETNLKQKRLWNKQKRKLWNTVQTLKQLSDDCAWLQQFDSSIPTKLQSKKDAGWELSSGHDSSLSLTVLCPFWQATCRAVCPMASSTSTLDTCWTRSCSSSVRPFTASQWICSPCTHEDFNKSAETDRSDRTRTHSQQSGPRCCRCWRLRCIPVTYSCTSSVWENKGATNTGKGSISSSSHFFSFNVSYSVNSSWKTTPT